jgi:hypothetical protein
VWLTESFGVHTGLHYGWYNYDYTYTTASDTLESGWSFRNLLLPVDLMYGFSLGNNRLVIGGGLSICRQLSGTLTELGNSYEIPDSLLETTIGPQVLVGFEIPTGRLTLCPSLKYVYGMDGLSARQLPLLPADQKISKHYILLCLGIFYSL